MNLAADSVTYGAGIRASVKQGAKEEGTGEGDGFARILGGSDADGPGVAASASNAKDRAGDPQQFSEDRGPQSTVTSPSLLAAMAGLALSQPSHAPHAATSPEEQSALEGAPSGKAAGTSSGAGLTPKEANAAGSDVPASPLLPPDAALQLQARGASPETGPDAAPKAATEPAGINRALDPAAPLASANADLESNSGKGAAAGPALTAGAAAMRSPTTLALAQSQSAPEIPSQSKQPSRPVSPTPAAAVAAAAPAVAGPAGPGSRQASLPEPSPSEGQVSAPAAPARTVSPNLAAAAVPAAGKGTSGGIKSDRGERRSEAKAQEAAAATGRASPSPAFNRPAAAASAAPAEATAGVPGSSPVGFTVVSTRMTAGGNTLVLQLQPHELGTVTAHIRMGADSVKIDLKAEDAETARLLAADGDMLRKALEAIGIGRDMSASVTISGPSAPPTVQGQPGQSGQTAAQNFQFSFGGDRAAGGNSGQGGGGRPSAGDQFSTSGQSRDGDPAQLSHSALHGLVV